MGWLSILLTNLPQIIEIINSIKDNAQGDDAQISADLGRVAQAVKARDAAVFGS